ERIRQVAGELGYRTNPLARGLPTGRTSLLGIVVADVTNPFFFEIIRGAEKTARDAGYTLLMVDAHESDEAERQALDRTLPLVEGMILATARGSCPPRAGGAGRGAGARPRRPRARRPRGAGARRRGACARRSGGSRSSTGNA